MVARHAPTRRVLHVSQPTDGGTAAVVRSLVAAGRAAGHQAGVACPDGALAAWAAAEGVERVRIPMERAPGPGDAVAAARLRQHVDGVDVVHLHSSKAGAVGRAALATLPRRRRPACVFTPHGWSWLVGGRAEPAYRAWERAASRWADRITVVSDPERAAGERVLGAGGRRLVQIDNGVDLEAFAPDGARARRQETPLVVCVGRLSRQKGQDRVLCALADVSERTTRLRLVGDGPDRDALVQRAAGLGLADRLELTGAADPRPHYRSADVVVVPSRWEGMPLVLLEAMACGAAVIASEAAVAGLRAPSVRLVGDPDDPSAWAAAIDELLAGPARRRAMGQASRAYVARHHDLAATTGRYLALYEELCG